MYERECKLYDACCICICYIFKHLQNIFDELEVNFIIGKINIFEYGKLTMVVIWDE